MPTYSVPALVHWASAGITPALQTQQHKHHLYNTSHLFPNSTQNILDEVSVSFIQSCHPEVKEDSPIPLHYTPVLFPPQMIQYTTKVYLTILPFSLQPLHLGKYSVSFISPPLFPPLLF